MENKLKIKLANGQYLVAEAYENGDKPTEMTVYIADEDGSAVQDLVLARQSVNPYTNEINPSAVQVLVWGDKESEDYTDRFEVSVAVPKVMYHYHIEETLDDPTDYASTERDITLASFEDETNTAILFGMNVTETQTEFYFVVEDDDTAVYINAKDHPELTLLELYNKIEESILNGTFTETF